ncbi:MAG TPA: LLM class F420-dependent oxidoreductase [Solirubrobacteraceae bacterium]|jgi:probable F420-dependent oxidoreductase|nr:LLM class F420-dependent oxidoreductase [Solirubrobacteraceae bacterium]
MVSVYPRLGLAVPIEGLPLRDALDLAVRASELGYDDCWSYEVNVSDGFTPLAWLTGQAPSLRLGISIIPAFTRPPALLAMTSASLQQLSGGRFVLGLGSSSPNIVERWMGGTYERPLTRVRETVEAVRLVLSAEKASYHGTTLRLDDFRLDMEPTPVPIMLGALGPRMFALAGEIGDGVITVFNSVAATAALIAECGPGDGFDVVSKLFIAVDEDDAALRDMLRRMLTGYGTVPAYNRYLARQGYAAQASAMAEAWARGDRRAALAAVDDEMLGQIFVFGSAADCARRLRDYAAAGVRTVLIAPMTAAGDPTERRRRVEHTIEQVALALGPASARRRD